MKNNKPLLIKSCFSHIGGKFGNALTIRFEEMGWLKKDPESKHFLITAKGEREFKKMGVDVRSIVGAH